MKDTKPKAKRLEQLGPGRYTPRMCRIETGLAHASKAAARKENKAWNLWITEAIELKLGVKP